MDDRQLLRQFAEHNSQEAFAALTTRYLNLVYSVCRRELSDDTQAEDVTQAVFLILARKAPTLRREVVLSGWLFQTARFAAKNARTREQRRKAYEQKAADAMGELHLECEDTAWAEIEPLLNQSLASLREAERECVLLRFFQGLSFAEVGSSLGLSEEAARKRVTRSLEKMRQFLTKNGVLVPSVVLAALLPIHAAKAAPATCQAGIAHLTTGAFAGSPIYQLSEGVLHAMKIAQMKVAVGITAAVLVGTTATYSIVRGAPTVSKTNTVTAINSPAAPPSPISSDMVKKILADSTLSKYRTVALTGKVHLPNGTPVGNVHLSAQMQNAFFAKMITGGSDEKQQEISGSFAHTRPDGTYTFYVGEDIAYNITVIPDNLLTGDDRDSRWVAAAAEGISGSKGATVHVPDLTLTPGGFVTGTVTDKISGKPIEGVSVGSYGPERPASSAAIIFTRSDKAGKYRLRVAPGKSLVYIVDDRYQEVGTEKGVTLTVAEGETKATNFQVTPKK